MQRNSLEAAEVTYPEVIGKQGKGHGQEEKGEKEDQEKGQEEAAAGRFLPNGPDRHHVSGEEEKEEKKEKLTLVCDPARCSTAIRWCQAPTEPWWAGLGLNA